MTFLQVMPLLLAAAVIVGIVALVVEALVTWALRRRRDE